MTVVTVVASQTTGIVVANVVCVRYAYDVIWHIRLGNVSRITVISVLGMVSIRTMTRSPCHAVLAERHRNRSVALQREPQSDQYREYRLPVIHEFIICH